jgi:hypothetical protein
MITFLSLSLIGTLEDTRIADVLKLLAAGAKTGLLTVSREGAQAVLRFHRGALVHAAAGRLQGDDAVLVLFGWRAGQLTFVQRGDTERLREGEPLGNVSRAVDALIAEGERSGALLHRLHELIPTDRVVFQTAPPADGARYEVGPAEWGVIRALDGVRDVREVVEASRLPRPDVMRILAEMASAGFIERVEPQKSLRAQAPRFFGRHGAEVDSRLDGDWRKIARFGAGVARVEVRSLAGKSRTLPVSFRQGLIRDIHLPRAALAELGVREGEDVSVRPVG